MSEVGEGDSPIAEVTEADVSRETRQKKDPPSLALEIPPEDDRLKQLNLLTEQFYDLAGREGFSRKEIGEGVEIDAGTELLVLLRETGPEGPNIR